jgi:hypothetical protein
MFRNGYPDTSIKDKLTKHKTIINYGRLPKYCVIAVISCLLMKTYQEIEQEGREKELIEAKRLLSFMNKKQALIFCKEMAKKLPSINDTAPIHRKSRENYMQFYMFGVSSAINSL